MIYFIHFFFSAAEHENVQLKASIRARVPGNDAIDKQVSGKLIMGKSTVENKPILVCDQSQLSPMEYKYWSFD